MQPGYGQPYGQPPYGQNPYGQPPAAPPAGGSYEFTQPENVVIGRLGSRAKTWGIISIIVGAIMLILGVVVIIAIDNAIATAAGAVIAAAALQPVVSGAFYLGAGGAFSNVVNTQGNDIPHMMSAMGKLTNAMRVEAIVAIIAMVAGTVLGIVLSGGN
jgi:hypothetical protein